MKKKSETKVFSVPLRSFKTILVMKQLIFLLFVCNLHVFSATHAQRINEFKVYNADLKSCIQKVEALTGNGFLYNGRELEQVKGISLELKDVDLQTVLNRLLENTDYSYSMIDGVIAIMKSAQKTEPAGQRTIKGTVRDQEGHPLPGVTVLLNNTQAGVATDISGRFELRIDNTPDAILVFSFVGMQTRKVRIGKEDTLNITLEASSEGLNEVVVTGFQTLSKERATGSFDLLRKEQLDKPASDLSERLIGTTSGLQGVIDKEGNMALEIRGQTSLNTSAKPLIVVDGFAVEGDFSAINPNDVESVTILKDAAAASIWGARSANGVIVITTKKGSKSQKGNPKVEISAFVKMSPKLDLDYYNPVATSAEVIEYEQRGYDCTLFGNRWGMVEDDVESITAGYSKAVVAMNEYRLGKLKEDEFQQTLETLRNSNNKEQIRKYLLQNPMIQQYNINISGGNERMSNMLSLLYENNKDNFKRNSNGKYMVNYRTNVGIFKWLDFHFSGMVQYNNVKNSGADFTTIRDLSPYEMLKNPDGSYTQVTKSYYMPNIERHLPTELFPYADWSYNPVQEINNRELGSKNLNIRIQTGLTLKLLEGLTVDSKVQYERFTTNTTGIYNEQTFNVRNTSNIWSAWDRDNNKVSPNLPKGGFKDSSESEVNSYDFRNQFNFDRTFGDRHEISVVGGFNLSEKNYQTTKNPRTYGYDDEKLTVGLLPNGPGGTFKPIYNWEGYQIKIPYTSSYTYSTDRYFSLFANAAYTYDRKYTLSGSIRTDASNLITDNNKFRYSPFWSLGLGWQIGKEKFMEQLEFLDRLNMRVTYGYNGNVDKSTSFKPLISVQATQDSYINDYIATISSYGNPRLRWEKTGTWNLGVDYSFFNNRLYGKIDVYTKKGKDLIVSMSIPQVNGTTSQKLNKAGMLNRGVEIEIGTNLPITDQIRWRGNVNFSYNKNKVSDYYKTSYKALELTSYGGTYNYMDGHTASALWAYQYAGAVNEGTDEIPLWRPRVKGPQGELLEFNSYNPPGDAREYVIDMGAKVAPYVLGFTSTFNIYDFDLSFIITGKFGHVYRGLAFNYPAMADGKALPNKKYKEIMNASPQDRVPIPFGQDKYTYGYMSWGSTYCPYLDYLTESANHVRFQEVSIAYNVPNQLLSRIGLSSLKVYVQGNNLGLIVKNSNGEDPEYPMGTSPKPEPAFTFGVKLGF